MALQIAAIAILTVFYGAYFAKMARQRRAGIQTDQMGRGKAGAARAIEIATKISALLMPFADWASMGMDAPSAALPLRCADAALAAVGDGLFILSMRTMRGNWRAGVSQDRTELVTEGIYRFSRNPAFLAFDLVYLGMLMMFPNGLLLAATAFAVIMLHLQVVYVEEPHLTAVFQEDYQAYRRRVRRYLGRRKA